MIRKPIKSPIQIKNENPLFLVKLASDLFKVHTDLMAKISHFIEESRIIKEEAQRIRNLPRGERGPVGEPGRPGKDGRDGRDGEDGNVVDINVIEEMISRMIPEKEEVVIPTMEEIIAQFKEALKDMPMSAFPAIAREVASYRNQLAVGDRGKLAGKKYGKNTWARGGGGSTSSGKNVTTQYLLTAVQSGADVTIDLTQLTNYATFDVLICIYRNNVPQTEGASFNFTKSGDTVTIFNADAGEVYNCTYSYA